MKVTGVQTSAIFFLFVFCPGLLKLNDDWYLFITPRLLPVISLSLWLQNQIATKELFSTKMNELGGFRGETCLSWEGSGEA